MLDLRDLDCIKVVKLCELPFDLLFKALLAKFHVVLELFWTHVGEEFT